MKRLTSVLLLILMILTTLVAVVPSVSAQGSKIIYEDGFDYDIFGESESIYNEQNIWQREFKTDTDDNFGFNEASAPFVKNGVLKFNEGDGIRLNWTNIDGFIFDRNKTYTVTFDFKVTNFGDDEPLSISSAWSRELYFAIAGYYNQIECRSSYFYGEQQGFRAGDKTDEYPLGGWTADGSDYKLNTTYRAIVEWIPGKSAVTSTVMNGGNVIAKGIRTGSDYADLNKYTRSFVWRCEDGNIEIDNVTFGDGENKYIQDFSLGTGENSGSAMCYTGIWAKETVERKCEIDPVLDDGVLKLNDKSSVAFNWLVVDGVDGYKADTIYTFDFDVKVTDRGDGSGWGGAYNTRALYVGFGGWFNFIELLNMDNLVIAGLKSVPYSDATYFDKVLHVSLVWEGASITATLSDAAGNALVSGTRTSSDFTNMVVRNSAMKYLVLRCEDGAVEVDNFKFTAESNEPVATTQLIPIENKQLIYEADIDYSGEGKVSFKLGSKEIIAISETQVKMCGKGLQTSYAAGTYKLRTLINAEQRMLTTKLTMPDGSVAIRSYYALLGSDTMYAYASGGNSVKNITMKSDSVTPNEYILDPAEPTYDDFRSKVYNLVTSFDVAQTTRNFAWTAKTSYLENVGMVLQYRPVGSDIWTSVDAVKEVEAYNTPDEDYFKCDITNLQPGTAYEYRIGKKGSTSDDDWSPEYRFETAPEKIDSFSFIAVGDTQGITWGGTTIAQKGFMYAKSAFDEAFEAQAAPAFILHTGDVVESGGNKNMWNMFLVITVQQHLCLPQWVTTMLGRIPRSISTTTSTIRTTVEQRLLIPL